MGSPKVLGNDLPFEGGLQSLQGRLSLICSSVQMAGDEPGVSLRNTAQT